ncbi:hypothetical protein BT69DRAFT_1347329 [Atractiella rhizophila]|nr:hypothetical protein BT69DRAFT_1347329 [Atractiella rhizophila]
MLLWFSFFLPALSLPPQQPFKFLSETTPQSTPLHPAALSDAVIESGFEARWDIADLTSHPHEDDTSAFAFDTISNLLQHWGNTRLRNGHNIVPGVLKPGTLLYHGAPNTTKPTGPEWFAFSPEHSTGFARLGWHLTISLERPVRILYFDGASAAKMPYGSMDTQDLVAWGEVTSDRFFDEQRRLKDLCSWGEKWMVEAFVRMEMDFEVMICDPTSDSFRTVNWQRLPWVVRDRPRGPPPPGGPGRPEHPKEPEKPGKSLLPPPRDEDTFDPIPIPDFPPGGSWPRWYGFETINAGSRHNHYPGNEHFDLFLSHLVSFYDTKRFPSLIETRRGQKRMDHRLIDLSAQDILLFEQASWGSAWSASNSVDWRNVVRGLHDRYSRRLKVLEHILFANSESLPDNQTRYNLTVLQAHVNLAPYVTLLPTSGDAANKTWVLPIWKLCAEAPTSHLPSDGETETDRFIRKSVDTVAREICRVVSLILAEGAAESASGAKSVDSVVQRWKAELRSLIDWLDWSEWVVCNPACSNEEICYLPTWPYFNSPRRDRPHDWKPQDQDWWYPKPKCLRTFAPYTPFSETLLADQHML